MVIKEYWSFNDGFNAIDFWDLEDEDIETGSTDEDPLFFENTNNFDQDDDVFLIHSALNEFLSFKYDEYNMVDADGTTYMGLVEDFLFH